ncbi:MAG: hypothetical protein WBX38_18620 [Candidatus Sulfotelmatobacter sp.]
MIQRVNIGILVVLLVALGAAWGQDSSAQQPADTPQEATPQQPVPAFGTDNPAPINSENPPISGLDLPNLEPHAAPLSYLQLGAHGSESFDSNIENALGGSGFNTITRALGSLELQRLWSHYDLSLDYLGGIGYYSAPDLGLKQIEEFGLDQKITWKRGEVHLRDAFSYQPEGTFGSAYGAVGATGAGLSGLTGLFGGTALGALGEVPRIMNVSVVDAVENLTPKSSITAIGAYGIVHFLGRDPETNTAFIGSDQTTAEVGYDRVFGPHDQGAIIYVYEGFDFSVGINFHSNIIQLMWGHRISGRMDFLISAGPQFTQIDNIPTPVTGTLTQADTIPPCTISASFQLECPTNDFRIGAAGRASLRYRFPKTSLDLSYLHYLTSGSGFFAGAESDIARVSVTRPLSRVWSMYSDIGYSRNSRELPVNCAAGSTNCPGLAGNIYQYDFAGIGVHRMLGRNFHAFASYQFNYLSLDDSYCQATVANLAGPCNRISQRHVGTIGLDWTPRPIRID